MKELIVLLLSLVGAYFAYGIFAEHIGLLLKNKKEQGVPIIAQIKYLLNKKLKK